ncbi:MAG: SpoIIE family protein phosphatase [Bacteroidia bacterium]|nr:SpoIIE family protein phosphatase [Bacteroidia bacterium]
MKLFFYKSIFFLLFALTLHYSVNAKTDTLRISQMLRTVDAELLTNRNAAVGMAQKAYVLSQQENYYKGMYTAYMKLGVIEQFYNARYDKALGYYLKALKLATDANIADDKINASVRAGSIYTREKMKKEAYAYLSKAYYDSKNSTNNTTRSFVLGRLGFYYFNVELKNELAILYFLKALKALNNQPNGDYGYLYVCLASAYNETGNTIVAERYANKALVEFKNDQDYVYLAYTFTLLSSFELNKGNIKKAFELATTGENIALKYGLSKELVDCKLALYNIYKKQNNEHQALLTIETYNALKDSVFSNSKSAKIGSVGSKEAISNYESELDIMNQENQNIKEQKNLFIILLSLGVLLLCVSVFFVISKIKSNKELHLKSDIIHAQSQEVMLKNSEIIDSINYAQRIQNALLPSLTELRTMFDHNYFILLKPRDIVSGDFFWITQQEHINYFAVADCTGHGVPGSFMSVLGNTILNEIVTIAKIKEPAEILNKLRERIIKDLKQTENAGANRDGMDISLCAYNTITKELKYAGANNEIYILKRNTENFEEPELLRLKADKMPVGIHYGVQKPFAQQSLIMETGDCVYLFSDGYLDQFGGPKGRKFKHSRFGELLSNMSELDIKEQGEMVIKTFEQWKGDIDQLDDVIVLGIEL